MDEAETRNALEQYHPESFGWALACCRRDPGEAEEVLQIVYLKVLDGRARFGGRCSFKTWLLALIHHTAVDEWRRKHRRQLRLVEFEAGAEELASGEPPDRVADRADLSALLAQALSTLPARQQEVLRLVFYHDLSLAEAAEVIGVSLGAARTHYDRGKKSLREWLERSNIFDEAGVE
jgi:RNA polymerase sigma-70 factor (ECF subfamily)